MGHVLPKTNQHVKYDEASMSGSRGGRLPVQMILLRKIHNLMFIGYWLLTQTVPLIIITTVVNNRYMSIQNNEQTKSMHIQYQHDQ